MMMLGGTVVQWIADNGWLVIRGIDNGLLIRFQGKAQLQWAGTGKHAPTAKNDFIHVLSYLSETYLHACCELFK